LQVNGVVADTEAIETAINGTPRQVVSRILSPRILKPRTAYRAFVVPTFERGRLVGTGTGKRTHRSPTGSRRAQRRCGS
jgi:hypothetical protein